MGDRLPLGAERFEQWSLEQLEDFIFALSFKRFILSDDRTATSQLAFVCNQEKKDVTVVSVFTRTRMRHAGYPAERDKPRSGTCRLDTLVIRAKWEGAGFGGR